MAKENAEMVIPKGSEPQFDQAHWVSEFLTERAVKAGRRGGPRAKRLKEEAQEARDKLSNLFVSVIY